MRFMLAAAALGLLAACATPADTAGRDCFRNADVDGYAVLDDDTVRVSVGPRRDYALAAPRLGRDLRWDHAIALHSDTGWICVGEGLGVEVTSSDIAPRRIHVRSVARIAEAAPAEGS